MNGMLPTLTDDQIRRLAPSVFAESPHESRSRRYRQVPTIEVIDLLRSRGFLPVRASQAHARTDDRRMVCRHLLRFRHEDYLGGPLARVGDEVPEVVLTNAHDGTAAYDFSLGIFRVACTNGLVVQSEDFGSVRVRHVGGPDFKSEVIDATFEVIDQAPKVMGQIEAWKQIELPAPARAAFAAAAAELKPVEGRIPTDLLIPRRPEDRDPSLWTTSNVIQEHLLKGGDRGRASTGRRTMTRPVKSVSEDVRLNRALWILTERLAEAMGG